MGSTFFYSFVLFLLLAPLYKGGNRALPLLLLELAAIGFLLALTLRRQAPDAGLRPGGGSGLGLGPGLGFRTLPRPLLVALGLLLAYPLLQLVPLPDALWRALPGHAEYIAVLERFAGPDAGLAGRPISVVPVATEFGWLALLPPLACLVVVRALAPADVVRLLLAMAVFTGVARPAGAAAGRRRRRLDLLPAQHHRARHGDRDLRQPRALRGHAGDDAAGDRRACCCSTSGRDGAAGGGTARRRTCCRSGR